MVRGGVGLGYLRPDQFLDHLTVIKRVYVSLTSIAPSTIDITTYHIMTLGNWNGLGWSVWSSGWGDYVVQLVFEWLGWSRLSELCFTQGRQVGHWSVYLGW